MISLEEYQSLKREVEKLQQQESKATGVIESLQKQLVELGCKNEEAAKATVKKLEKEEIKLQKEYELALEKFQVKWKEKL